MKAFIETLIVFSSGFVLTASLVFVFANFFGQHSCYKYAEATGRETKWAFMDRCYINNDNEWLTREEYKAVITAREGLQ